MTDSLPKGAIANRQRKQVRINIAKQALKTLSPKVKFPNRTHVFDYIADAVRTHEKLTNTETKKGPCSRSGVYSVPEIKIVVEKFWLTGLLIDDDIDLHQTADAAAKAKLLDQEIEISNLRFELKEKSRFLNETDEINSKLRDYIKLHDFSGGQHVLEDKQPITQSDSNVDDEKVIEALCQIIFKLECWGDGLIERSKDGAFIDMTNDTDITSEKLMHEYIKRVPVSKVKG